MDILSFLLIVLAALAGVAAGALAYRAVSVKRVGDADELAKRIVEEARKEAQAQKKEILLQGQDDLFNQKRELENEFKEREREIKVRERKLDELGDRLEEKLEKATVKEHELLGIEKDLARKERRLSESEEFLQTRIEEQEQRLSQIAGLTAEEAKARLFAEVEARTRHESARMIRQIETEARETADRKAKDILCNVIQRYAGDYVNEQTVTAVSLPSEDMKGRIIGREGRNIRALEAATGVDLIIDDTPETVILSAYSPLRRQVAKMALERLIQDGRIHPARIEGIVQKCEQELDVQVREVGEQATFDAGVHGIHPEIVRLLGQLRYRTSFTQNVLQHSLEVSALCGMMAAELGMDVKKAKRAGLLHDIGKAVDHEVEGPHALIGADIAKKYSENQEIIHAIAAHHEDQRPS
ncbi:MAG: ribonuclease Y, partial [Desulfovibrionaceae bacterium]|nr:ribonuclease Y [Desulfovibrionaceae bacterium]